jgi:hypothetical protein
MQKPSLYDGKMKGRPISKLIPAGDQLANFGTREYWDEPFLIHGQGEKGSDGCIVIGHDDRRALLDAVEDAGGAILLVTYALDDRTRLTWSPTKNAYQ